MSRYETTAQIKTENGMRRAATTIVKIPLTDSDQYIQVTSMERLDKLAAEFYGDQSLWWLIAAANGLGKGTLLVPQNTLLRIPPANGINDYIYKINQER